MRNKVGICVIILVLAMTNVSCARENESNHSDSQMNLQGDQSQEAEKDVAGITKPEETKDSEEEPLPDSFNSYWNTQGNDEVEFNGEVWFDEFGDVSALDYETKVNFVEVAKLKKGILYQLKIDQMSDFKIPKERLSLGYFYVQKDKIMRIWEDKGHDAQGNVWTLSKKTLNRIIENGEIPKHSAIVCQEKGYEDTLKNDKIGWHQYLKIEDESKERIRYGGWYQYPHHSGYWETFIWEKENGLIYYKSGYRDGIDYIILKKKDVNITDDLQ